MSSVLHMINKFCNKIIILKTDKTDISLIGREIERQRDRGAYVKMLSFGKIIYHCYG
jgi:hypothetical protein